MLAILLMLNGFLAMSEDVVHTGAVIVHMNMRPGGELLATSLDLKGAVRRTGRGFTVEKSTLELKTLTTENSGRDKHMHHKYLEIEKFPEAKFELVSAENGKFKGTITLRAKKKEVEGEYTIDGSVLIAKFKSSFQDFGIKKANWLRVGVEDEFEVEVKYSLNGKEIKL